MKIWPQATSIVEAAPNNSAPSPAPRETGHVARWFSDPGYGFINPDLGGVDVFFHVRALIAQSIADQEKLRAGTRVEYELVPGPDGRLRAARVRVIEDA
jgi:cold shock CspA family protein